MVKKYDKDDVFYGIAGAIGKAIGFTKIGIKKGIELKDKAVKTSEEIKFERQRKEVYRQQMQTIKELEQEEANDNYLRSVSQDELNRMANLLYEKKYSIKQEVYEKELDRISRIKKERVDQQKLDKAIETAEFWENSPTNLVVWSADNWYNCDICENFNERILNHAQLRTLLIKHAKNDIKCETYCYVTQSYIPEDWSETTIKDRTINDDMFNNFIEKGLPLPWLKKLVLKSEENIRNNRNIYEEFDIIDALGGVEFEEYCADLLTRLGFDNVIITVATGDQGIDVLAKKDNLKYGIQSKRYQGKISNKAIQEAHAGKVFYDLDIAIVATNSYFTNSAIDLADKVDVILWDRDKLKQLILDTKQL